MMERTYRTDIQCDVPTPNGRIYPRVVLEQAIEDYLLKDEMMRVGTFREDMNDYGTMIDVSMISHIVDEVYLDDDGFMCVDVRILASMQRGLLAMQMPDSIEITPVMIATVHEDNTIGTDLDIRYFSFSMIADEVEEVESLSEIDMRKGIQEFFAACPNRTVPIDGPIGICWSLEGTGVGELWFGWDAGAGTVYCDSEMMSKESVKEILCNMVDNCELR